MSANIEKAREIFVAAVGKLAPEEWDTYLAEVCAGDVELSRRVKRLLQLDAGAGSFLESPAAAAFATVDHPVHERPGTVIGSYKLLEEIGEGGMGLVFVAEQQQPVKRRVALKIIKPGMDSRQVIARFEAERQALAMMDHPNIAKVHDGGATPEGRPYFVMELVKGTPITEYCDRHRLTNRQRLELFLDVCHAVQHAHQKGIIHRDLKPSNVLVSHHDVRAVVKVIDFGVAKATGQQLTDRSIYTGFAQMIGTPLYMSPEQAGLSDLDVDTRSDVYSLGVLLYELLTSTTPFDNETLKKAGYDEMRRIIREDEPPKPSTRFYTLAVRALSTIADNRGATPGILSTQVRGELDWIVMKALEKDRDRRYESASALAADVQRYLNDEAVAACPPSSAYRLRKYVRRNQRALVTAGVIASALIAATVVSTWQAVVARDALGQAETARKDAEADRDRAEAAESRAATEAAIARAVNAFLQEDLIGQMAGAPMSGREIEGKRYVTVKEALDRAASRIGDRFRDQPLVEAAIRASVAIGYRKLYEFQLALPHFERAVALRKAHLGLDYPDTRDIMGRLAEDYTRLGRHAEAIELGQQLLENRRAVLGPDHRETRARSAALASSYEYSGHLEKSVPLWEQVLEQNRTLDGETHPSTLGVMFDLAWNYGMMGRLEESLALFEKYYTLRKGPVVSEDGSNWELGWFVQVCQWAGKFDRADRPLREAIAKARKDKGSVNERNDLANHLGYLAVNLLLQGRYDEAEPLAREAVAKSQIGDAKHYYWVSALGAVLLGQQKYAESEPLLLQGYKGMEQDGLADHVAMRKRMTEVAGRIVRLYELTNQTEKARVWREKLKSAPHSGPR
ncbi:MAG TPA: serine/threonine-protein kinase [Gemmataceae bacterium]|nr:serine/threonine-protein kinase [Gemmataceae bacterium]